MKHAQAHILQAIIDMDVIESEQDGKWVKLTHGQALYQVAQGTAHSLRVKPPTVKIGVVDCPASGKAKPPSGDTYYTIDPALESGVVEYTWTDHILDERVFSSGLFWLNKEDALTTAQALKALFRPT